MKYGLTNADIKELTKLYPKIRVPFFEQADYYLALQEHTIPVTDHVQLLRDCKDKHGEIGSYKMKKLDEILAFFKDESGMMTTLNDIKLENYHSEYPKQFNDWDDDEVYMSVDISEANWSIFKLHTDNMNLPTWPEFSKQKFDLHPFISESKSYRQLVFGNLNPNRQIHLQKQYMLEIARMYEKYFYFSAFIVMVSNDEILIRFANEDAYRNRNLIFENGLSKLSLKTKCKVFRTTRMESCDETILVKYPYDPSHRVCRKDYEMFAVPGNRFFIHYKNLVLNEPVVDNDLYFEPEPKRLAKWVIKKTEPIKEESKEIPHNENYKEEKYEPGEYVILLGYNNKLAKVSRVRDEVTLELEGIAFPDGTPNGHYTKYIRHATKEEIENG